MAEGKIDRRDVRVRREIRIPLSGSDETLSGDLYLPVGKGPFPALLTAVPFRTDALAGIVYEKPLRWFASQGYACLLLNLRGIGSSDGTVRPAFDDGEADDAIAGISWLASQSWSTGRVGMWGHSYGAIMTLRTAARNPSSLGAILPYQGLLNPVQHYHPYGNRGGQPIARVAASLFALQLLPPLHGVSPKRERERWSTRLLAKPFALDMFEHGPKNSFWDDRKIDGQGIRAASLCVGGWRDSLCEGLLSAYETIVSPKKLVMGPWTHTFPSDSSVEPIDFFGLALRWWDYWLRDIDNGIMNEPNVSLYIQNDGWRQFGDWPVASCFLNYSAKSEQTLKARDATFARSPEEALGCDAIGIYSSNSTIGALSGMWGMPTSDYGLPQDQHDDDMRSLFVETDTLKRDIFIGGRPEITLSVDLNESRLDEQQHPIVIRLTDVDSVGRSKLITAGMGNWEKGASQISMSLWPTAYRIPSGNRLRLTISDSAFPLIMPPRLPITIAVTSVGMVIPVTPASSGREWTPAYAKAFDPLSKADPRCGGKKTWSISRDILDDRLTVTWTSATTVETAWRNHLLELGQSGTASVRNNAPEEGIVTVTENIRGILTDGSNFKVIATAHLTQLELSITGHVELDGRSVHVPSWSFTIE